MPYSIVKMPGGKAKVKKKQPGRPRFFSKKPISMERAKAQIRALYLKEKK